METKYKEWITANYPTPESARMQCVNATKQMITKFPELKLVKGSVHVEEPYDLPPTITGHYWCATEEGEIVDPTAHQYPTRIIKYTSFGDKIPTGKCTNCGGYCFNNMILCSDKCSREYLNYISE